MSLENLQIGKIYTFDTTAPAVLGISIKNAKLVSIMDYQSASMMENVNMRYRTIYPLLPNGTPDTAELSIYYLFKSEAGPGLLMADVWIAASTIVQVEHVNFQITMTEAALSDIPKIRDMLNAAGYVSFQIKQI